MTVRGTAELTKFFKDFPARLQKNAVRSGLRAAAGEFREQARINIPKDQGVTAKAIKSSSPKEVSPGVTTIKVRMKGKNASVGHWLEFGVDPHIISSGIQGVSADTLNRLKVGDSFISGSVMHPGISPHPFMRPAFDARTDDAISAFGEQVTNFLAGRVGISADLLRDEED